MKGFFKSKTMWFSAITALTGVVQSVAPFIPADKVGQILAGLGAAAGLLRYVTKVPLDQK